MIVLLCIIMCMSGFAALSFELVWFHLCGLALGNSIWATSAVLAAFMAGLALGNGLAALWGRRIRHAIRFYALLEFTIAISGIGLIFILPLVPEIFVPLFHLMPDDIVIITFLKFFMAFLLMLVPTTAMGATLPVLVRALYQEKQNFGHVLGILYGWNTFGAVLGVIVSEIWLLTWVGIQGTGLIAGSLDVTAACLALVLGTIAFRSTAVDAGPGRRHFCPTAAIPALTASFLSGFALLALEMIWFRFLNLFFASSSLNFALMLAVVLIGISLGGLFIARGFRTGTDLPDSLTNILILNGVMLLVLYWHFDRALALFGSFDSPLRIVAISLVLMFPISFVSGIIFTMFGHLVHAAVDHEVEAAGLLTMVNTTGGMLGALAGGFILIPFLGMETSFFVLSVLYVIIGVLLIDRSRLRKRRGRLLVTASLAVAFIASALSFPFGKMNSFASIPWSHLTGFDRVAMREGLTETVQYLQRDLIGQPYQHVLMTNSFGMSATTLDAKRYMKYFVYWPVAVHPNIEDALLICFGCGVTAKALTETRHIQTIDIVDTSRDIIELSDVIYPSRTDNPVHDPRVNVHIEDGRFFLLTTDKRYDLITAEPPPPGTKGIVNLYSREYFQLVHSRLAEGGMVTYWLPCHFLESADARSILMAFTDVFDTASLWLGANLNYMMVGVRHASQPVADDTFRRQWLDTASARELRGLGFDSPEQFGSLFIADRPRIREWCAGAPPLLDNFPHRISYTSFRLPSPLSMSDYRELTDTQRSLDNFRRSEFIGTIWPATLRQEAEQHFPVRNIINDVLSGGSMQTTSPLMNLHSCVVDPRLQPYILWACFSDRYAGDIIARSPAEQRLRHVEYYFHAAANAAASRDFRRAADLYRTATDTFGPQLDIKTHYLYRVFRMYFLYLSGDKTGAYKVIDEYANLSPLNREARRKQIEQYWFWLVMELDKPDH